MVYDELYCKIYLDTNLTYENLFAAIIKCTNGKKDALTYIVTDWSEISVQRNKEYSEMAYLKNAHDFLNWRYYLDIEPNNKSKENYIDEVCKLSQMLKKYCKGVVPSCDFEDEVNSYI